MAPYVNAYILHIIYFKNKQNTLASTTYCRVSRLRLGCKMSILACKHKHDPIITFVKVYTISFEIHIITTKQTVLCFTCNIIHVQLYFVLRYIKLSPFPLLFSTYTLFSVLCRKLQRYYKYLQS